MRFKKIIQGIAFSALLLIGWAVFKSLPTEYWNIRLAEAATSIYPKDATTFITIPFIFRGASVKDKDLTTDSGLS